MLKNLLFTQGMLGISLLSLLVSDSGWAADDALMDATRSSVHIDTSIIDSESESTRRSIRAPMAVEQAVLLASDGAAGDRLGEAVSLDGNRAVVGARLDDPNGSNSGSAYVFEFDGTQWVETAQLLPSDGGIEDQFGWAVNVSGDRVLVGSSNDDENGSNAGAAYVFDLNNGVWEQTAKLIVSDPGPNANFGIAVSLEGDRALIGARRDDDNGFESGSAYIFDFNGLAWEETAKLLASDGQAVDYFGSAVSLSGDRALVGARFEDAVGSDSGAAYMFELDAFGWSQTQKLLPSDAAAFDIFGVQVSIDGDRALIGAQRNNDAGSRSGSAYIFEFSGQNWTERAKLVASDAAAEDLFGSSVSIQGTRAVVGALFDDDDGTDSGAAYVFEPSVSGWDEVLKITASDAAAGDFFGFPVSQSGKRVLLGAYGKNDLGADAGSAYVYSINRPPIAEPDGFFIVEDATLTGNVFEDNGFGADFDPDGDSFEVNMPGNLGIFTGIGGSGTIEANGDFTYQPPPDVSGDTSFEYFIVDSDGAFAIGTVTITVLSANDAPTFAAIDPSAVLEDSGAQSISNWATFDAGAPNEMQGVLGYAVANLSNAALFAAGPTVAGSGTLSFTPAADAFGTSTFDVTVQDDGGTANGGVDTSDPQTFTITIDPVNDTPSFANAGDVTEIEDGDYAEPWASAISAGPANESGQTVTFMTTVTSNPGLFAVAPTVDPAGTLTFTPVADTTGMATIEVVAMDDGGVANGGVDLSDPVSFTIDVIAAADLTIDKTSGSFFTEPGGTITYSIVVSNPGPSDVTQATVTDQPPVRLGNVSWTCTPSGAAACNPTGAVEINELINLPEGTSVTFTLDATLLDDLNDPITNIASVTTPVGVLELVPANNTDSDTDRVGLFADGMESVEP